MPNPVEIWKSQKHGFDVWPDLVQYAAAKTPMKEIETPDLERMKWHGVYYRKNDTPGSYMLRIRLTGCELTAQQAKAIAYVAYDFGYGIVDITTRANIQIQGLKIEDVPAALDVAKSFVGRRVTVSTCLFFSFNTALRAFTSLLDVSLRCNGFAVVSSDAAHYRTT